MPLMVAPSFPPSDLNFPFLESAPEDNLYFSFAFELLKSPKVAPSPQYRAFDPSIYSSTILALTEPFPKSPPSLVQDIVAQTAAVIVSIDSNFLMLNMFYDYSDASIPGSPRCSG